MDTLYVTDLDGTLLNSWKRIPADSVPILRQLIEDGAAVTVATARSVSGLKLVKIDDVPFRLPLILMNGVMLYDAAEERIVDYVGWDAATTGSLLDACRGLGRDPFLYHVEDGALAVEYRRLETGIEKRFLAERQHLVPGMFREVEEFSAGGAVYLSMQDREPVLQEIAKKLRAIPGVALTIYSDNYNFNNFILEAFHVNAGKGNAVRRLRRMYDVERVVAFGDNYNDLPLFEAADLSCAVANAPPSVRDYADVVIGSNVSDAVARYIRDDYKSRTA